MYKYIYIYICMYIYINFKAIDSVLDGKLVSKSHLLIKIFHLLYRSFVSLIRPSRSKKQNLTQQLIYVKTKMITNINTYIHIYIYIYIYINLICLLICKC